jgi:serine/threonine protein phosphatase PrpC
LIFEFASVTDPGLVRENNEDSVACDPGYGVAVLADGMGGYNAGEIASAMAVTFIRAEVARWLAEAGPRLTGQDVRRAMELCVSQANQSIYNAAISNPQFSGMGTTIVVGVFEPGRVVLGHVGDSRCYVFRAGRLTQLTRDHSLLQEQLEAGLITPEQAKVATHKNLVTRALGVDEGVMVDIQEHVPQEGDVYLMCSDGLTDMVDDELVSALLMGPDSLSEKAQNLVRAANEAGGRDNISVILTQVKAKSGTAGFFSRVLRMN